MVPFPSPLKLSVFSQDFVAVLVICKPALALPCSRNTSPLHLSLPPRFPRFCIFQESGCAGPGSRFLIYLLRLLHRFWARLGRWKSNVDVSWVKFGHGVGEGPGVLASQRLQLHICRSTFTSVHSTPRSPAGLSCHPPHLGSLSSAFCIHRSAFAEV